MTLSLDDIVELPKVLLHDHLDGGLRPATVVDLAAEVGHQLPASDPEALARWFVSSADSGSLDRYLTTFAHTVAVMQTAPALRRVARECAIDLAADGVVYAEVRFAPEQHLTAGLTLPEVVEAVRQGFDQGVAQAAAQGRTIRIGMLLTAMRHACRSLEIAELAVAHRDSGVVGFDIAGAEAGHPPTRHLAAFEFLRQQNAHFTVHAGEAVGLESIWQALQSCGAGRLGHGVRIIEDIDQQSGRLGRLAGYVLDRRIPLELCPSSNVQTGAAASIASHPLRLLHDLGFRATVNTDNRLMSGTSTSRELWLVAQAFGWGCPELQWLTINAMKSAFIPYRERLAIINDVIKPAFVDH